MVLLDCMLVKSQSRISLLNKVRLEMFLLSKKLVKSGSISIAVIFSTI